MEAVVHTPMRVFMAAGESGTGTTTNAKMVAQLLGMPYYFFTCGEGTNETDLVSAMIPNIGSKKAEPVMDLLIWICRWTRHPERLSERSGREGLCHQQQFITCDLTSMRIETLTFEEFMDALGQSEVYERLSLYGDSGPEDYAKVQEAYEVYWWIGGYPAVVTEYLETGTFQKCREKLEDVIWLFCSEFIRYDNLFCSVSRLLLREKKGLEENSVSESGR